MIPRFDRDTSATRIADNTYAVSVNDGWWVDRGPNGGYLAGIITQALILEVNDAERQMRSITVHYLSPPVAGAATVHVHTERRGRLVQYLTATMFQGDRMVAKAFAAFGVSNPTSPTFADPSYPGYPTPAEMEYVTDPPGLSEIRNRYEYLHVMGAPWDELGPEAVSGGWLRLREPRPYDAALITAMCDAWNPPVYARLRNDVAVPTLDLTVHLRSVAAMQRLRPDDWVAVRFRSTIAAEGYLEEDGQIWAPDGTLIAHSRQLAVLLAF